MKTRLLKITLSFAMLFIAAGAFAQPYQPYAEMSGSSADGINDTVTVSGDSIKYMPYYVEPDATINSLSSDYVPGTSPEDQGVYTTFDWTFSGGAADTLHATTDSEPYVEISFTDVANYELSVTETAPSGTCSGSAVINNIEVVAEPSFSVTNDTVEMCDNTGYSISVDNIADNGVSGGNLKFKVDSVVENIDATGNIIGTPIDSARVYQTIPESNIGTGAEIFNEDLVTINNEITRYSFTFHGMNDHISRKSDYLDLSTSDGSVDSEYTYYPSSSGNSLVYIVYPTPQTGEIYYVPNNFDQ